MVWTATLKQITILEARDKVRVIFEYREESESFSVQKEHLYDVSAIEGMSLNQIETQLTNVMNSDATVIKNKYTQRTRIQGLLGSFQNIEV